MANPEILVQDFRNIVERTLEGAGASPLHGFGVVGDLQVASVDQYDARHPSFGLHAEHIWGLGPTGEQACQIERKAYPGRLVILSLESQPNSLVRHWSLSTVHTPFNSVDVERPIEEEHLETVVEWARSPHLYPEALGKIAVLSEDERVSAIEKLSTSWGYDRFRRQQIRRLRGALRTPRPVRRSRIA